MPDFVYDALALPYPKANLAGLPPGANPAEWVQDTDWNQACQAMLDLRSAILTGRFFGYIPQGAAPGAAGATYTWIDSALQFLLRRADGTDRALRQLRRGTTTTSDALGQTLDLAAYDTAGDGEAVTLQAQVTTIRDTAAAAVGFSIAGVFRRAAGVVTQEGATTIQRIPAAAGPPNATLAIVGTGVVLRLTGIAAQVYAWQVETAATVVA